MPPRDKSGPEPVTPEGSPTIDGLLSIIEDEKVPERLLVLANDLQQVLNRRRAETAGDEE